ncbi:MAG: hypothetical protein IBJ17_11425, partial [Reyranella sp.]|nr:hypothetical protein [Reyranella sp.]
MRFSPFVALLALVFATPLAAQEREEIVRVPGPGGANLIATVLRPPGEAKAPVVVINHGSPADGSQRTTMQRPKYPTLSSWFLAKGYVVALPLRRGYGESGGTWAESSGACGTPDSYTPALQ